VKEQCCQQKVLNHLGIMGGQSGASPVSLAPKNKKK
jgi:hypothetical protein